MKTQFFQITACSFTDFSFSFICNRLVQKLCDKIKLKY